jgi:protease I
MAKESLKGLNVAILVTDGFEQVELTEPRKALDEAGAKTQIVSPKNEHVRAWKFTDWGIAADLDVICLSVHSGCGPHTRAVTYM